MGVEPLLCRILLVALLLTACASGPSPRGAGHAGRTPEELANTVYESLKRDDIGGVVDTFDGDLARALSSLQLREVWRGLVDEMGALQSWTPLSRQTLPNGSATVRLEYDLHFQRGHMIGTLGVSHAATDSELAGIFFRPAVTPPPPTQPPAATVPGLPGIHNEEVVIGAPPWQLGGTLTLPHGGGPHPTALLVQGSGPQDRDETVGPNKPFRDIAEGLASRGVAVLRYDKRTWVHGSQMDALHATVEEEVIQDALAALALLHRRPDVRRGAVFVVGHSLGALLAPEIAVRDGQIAGVALLGPPGRSLPRTIIDQLRFLHAVAEPKLAELEIQAKRVDQRTAPATEVFVGVPVHYFLDLASRDAFAAARNLNKPILLLRGARDYQVTAEDMAIWQERLQGVAGTSVHTLANLNHFFLPGQGPAGPAEYKVVGHVAPSVPLIIASFFKNALAAAP